MESRAFARNVGTLPSRQLKVDLDTDFWIHWLPDTPHRRLRQEMADRIATELPGSRLDPEAHFTHLSLALTGYTGALLQPAYVEIYGGLSEAEVDEVSRRLRWHGARSIVASSRS